MPQSQVKRLTLPPVEAKPLSLEDVLPKRFYYIFDRRNDIGVSPRFSEPSQPFPLVGVRLLALSFDLKSDRHNTPLLPAIDMAGNVGYSLLIVLSVPTHTIGDPGRMITPKERIGESFEIFHNGTLNLGL